MNNIHLLDTRNLDEIQLKQLLISKLSSDFELRPDVDGIYIVEPKPVKIDFLLRAKSHIIDGGFTPEWFGVEVKNIYHNGIPKSGKINEVFWQALTYAQSKFDEKRLPFVLVLVNDDYSKIDDRKTDKKTENFDSLTFMFVARFCQYGNIGKLELEKNGYSVVFDNNFYFRRRNGEMQKGKTNVGIKRNIGNVS